MLDLWRNSEYKIICSNPEGTSLVNFHYTSCTSRCGEVTVGIYETTDNLGTSYYYRGDVENNYVSFAGYYWRIIRINGDGSIRIIYDGTSAHANGESSEDRQIGTSAFNSSSHRYSYGVGYTYSEGYQRPSLAPDTIEEQDSTIKGVLDSWYQTNIANQGLDDKVVSTAGFCNDREIETGYTWSSEPTDYAANERLNANRTPTLQCSNNNDLYTTKIGLITADEVAMAGGTVPSFNQSYYLYTGARNGYWTMSPRSFSDYALVFLVDSDGSLGWNYVYRTWYGVRPVLNLSADVTITGSGTIQDPYVVQT